MTTQRTHETRPVNELLRHDCTGCGGCCQGVRVPVYDHAERAKVERAAAALGVVDPIDGRALRMVAGRCVFLAHDDRCRIHAALGPEAKPIPCRQFPLIALSAGQEIRIGVDPASYGAWRSWRDGSPLPDGPVVASSPPPPGGQAQAERALVALCEDPDASIPGLIAVLTREPAPAGAVPAGFAARWAERLGQVDLGAFLAHDAVGPNLRRGLAPLAAAAPSWVGRPPVWPSTLREEDHRWAVEAVRRVIYLRLMPEIPNVSAAALLTLGGVVAAAWTDPAPERFHPALTAWIRALRFTAFWSSVAGDRETMVWLGTGVRPELP
jgi:hypothetical protein